MKLDISILLLVILLAVVVLTLLINRKYHYTKEWIVVIKRFSPLFLIFFPAIITYFFVCGSLSALAVVIYAALFEDKDFNRDEFLMMEKCVEYACSFIMPLIYFRVLKKNNFPFFWSIVITIVHMLVAGYRDAKYIMEPIAGKENHFESGPIILPQIGLVDALIPAFSFLLFYTLFQRTFIAKTSESTDQ